MVPAALRFSTPKPLSFPMMSSRTYLQGKWSCGVGTTHLHDVPGRMLRWELHPGGV